MQITGQASYAGLYFIGDQEAENINNRHNLIDSLYLVEELNVKRIFVP
ncbi:MAG TPA: hypothetical protein VK184_19185 [Nostocaceae cyanobacterium]|nr:hypothetical protein [Nostocaceae cyanobacterium]